MTLRCLECKTQYSVGALACPHCGSIDHLPEHEYQARLAAEAVAVSAEDAGQVAPDGKPDEQRSGRAGKAPR